MSLDALVNGVLSRCIKSKKAFKQKIFLTSILNAKLHA